MRSGTFYVILIIIVIYSYSASKNYQHFENFDICVQNWIKVNINYFLCWHVKARPHRKQIRHISHSLQSFIRFSNTIHIKYNHCLHYIQHSWFYCCLSRRNLAWNISLLFVPSGSIFSKWVKMISLLNLHTQTRFRPIHLFLQHENIHWKRCPIDPKNFFDITLYQ